MIFGRGARIWARSDGPILHAQPEPGEYVVRRVWRFFFMFINPFEKFFLQTITPIDIMKMHNHYISHKHEA